jgi:hypothetical protein
LTLNIPRAHLLPAKQRQASNRPDHASLIMTVALIKLWQLYSLIKNRVQARTAANFRLRITLLVLISLINVGLGGVLYNGLHQDKAGAKHCSQSMR